MKREHRYPQFHGDLPPAKSLTDIVTEAAEARAELSQPECPPLPVVRDDSCPGCGAPGGRQCRVPRSGCGY